MKIFRKWEIQNCRNYLSFRQNKLIDSSEVHRTWTSTNAKRRTVWVGILVAIRMFNWFERIRSMMVVTRPNSKCEHIKWQYDSQKFQCHKTNQISGKQIINSEIQLFYGHPKYFTTMLTCNGVRILSPGLNPVWSNSASNFLFKKIHLRNCTLALFFVICGKYNCANSLYP